MMPSAAATLWETPALGSYPHHAPTIPSAPGSTAVSNDVGLPRSLDALRDLAEECAHVEYARGPGQNTKMGVTSDIEENKRRKKKKSAYITRFRQKHYESLLERVVAVGEAEMRTGAEIRRELQGNNDKLREQLRMLQRMVAVQTQSPIHVSVGQQDESVVMEDSSSPRSKVPTMKSEDIAAGIVAAGEAIDLAAAGLTSDGTTSSWMRDLTATTIGADADAETQSTATSSDLTSIDSTLGARTNVFAPQTTYTKRSYEEFMMDDHNPPFINQDVSNLLAALTKAA